MLDLHTQDVMCVMRLHRMRFNCLETTLPLPRAKGAKGTACACLSRRKGCMLHGCALSAIVFECLPAVLHLRLRKNATQSIVSNACLPMTARTYPHKTHTRDCTCHHTSKAVASTINGTCLRDQRHLQPQPMASANKFHCAQRKQWLGHHRHG